MSDRPTEEPVARRVRPDVQRNLDALLTAAAEIFASDGVDAPVRRITARAGVGAGTLYRHFPQRSDLITAVFRHEVDACAEAAPALAEQHEPVEALTLWLQRFARFVAAKRGLKAALHSGDPAYESLPAYFQQRFLPVVTELLESAAASGELRAEIPPYDLLRAISDLVSPDDQGYTQRMIALLVNGLRHGTDGALPPATDGERG
ncbi:TetR/AcrR family transcriptional regulator [Streptomyces poriferorum]|uniref:TetR/AcrR family transcriptional regulator n=1 Tax=Streptomyces TaxID=1883 RepID=UPI001C5DFD2A|nr:MULTISPECIES: TetR/AcrR family transcriptional regulator [Streptomyces]WSQ41644.1 TetR/AcrR family transcriptional regulator [Streptomyces sp. NBC_01220]MBW5248589.1 TetR/AcrR family transcriptional regulator [Streptomyces poriferorum]MBW5256046.1 TetR/AcrR family transcriptional regulator [Streptomyces poriferorum]WLQ53038.1 TetR/AcrR family transcriptional regulator [Streptomyces sp. Alt1]WSI67931.1 TetR/AcrR family transcriptional regulator [Streptomyces sp. NBC_01336]